ncbi:PREDICTED: zinc finger protein on ecdysone puffs-like isoform X2 [Nicrophorus vespilloides]|uniref:Zinc finger protein on ecdysone puffs-like isoform X2 n=1 Tax=Nicrophorus vespilloides TaxID=110193 RepID=A0ABM1MZS2_NICVS|nr:PREDICTED: zinc finger protein on ecdysone puffs-like isoform X2 [Nicrophorus vespilloides]
MSYYKPSYNQTVAMSRGGRGGFSSSRGSSYRGSSRGSSWTGSRGSYSSSSRGNGRGKFSNSFSNSSFDSRSKYPSSDKYAGSRSHNDEYRKSYKPESGSYSNKDHRSPDRKRMRTESSHERSFGSGSREYNSSRYESDRRSFSSDGRSSGPFSGRKEEFRKPPPPPPPISSSPRGGYRGRVSSRGMIRSRLRERPLSSSVRRTRLLESSYGVRRRVLTGRTHDYARRLKISKMRRKKEETSDKEEEDDEEDSDIDMADEKTIIKSEDVEDEVREHKSSDETEKKTTPKKTSPKKEEEVASDKEDSKDDDTDEKNKSFIKLTCPHCLTRSTTFAKYSMHLHSGRHASAMRRVAMKQKSILSQMRLVQRRAQRELEKNASDLALRTSWCPLCKLNYKQAKLTHQTSQAHKDMKKFLMPYCKICKLTFKSPMLYESHCCSIEHIKRKSTATGGDDISDKEETEEDLENFMTIDSVGDMDEEGDTAEKKEGGDSKSKEHINVGIENIKKVEVHYCDLCRLYLPRVSEDEEMNKILVRHCRQRTHLQKYIRYKEDRELAKKAEKLQRKETAEKEKEKEEEASHKETDDKIDDPSVEKKKENDIPKKDGASEDTETANVEEEKIWADVDKDLGDILAEAESGTKSSDEDEDSVANGERYDRFKYSEKNGKKMKVKVEEKDEETKKLEDAEAEK